MKRVCAAERSAPSCQSDRCVHWPSLISRKAGKNACPAVQTLLPRHLSFPSGSQPTLSTLAGSQTHSHCQVIQGALAGWVSRHSHNQCEECLSLYLSIGIYLYWQWNMIEQQRTTMVVMTTVVHLTDAATCLPVCLPAAIWLLETSSEQERFPFLAFLFSCVCVCVFFFRYCIQEWDCWVIQ